MTNSKVSSSSSGTSGTSSSITTTNSGRINTFNKNYGVSSTASTVSTITTKSCSSGSSSSTSASPSVSASSQTSFQSQLQLSKSASVAVMSTTTKTTTKSAMSSVKNIRKPSPVKFIRWFSGGLMLFAVSLYPLASIRLFRYACIGTNMNHHHHHNDMTGSTGIGSMSELLFDSTSEDLYGHHNANLLRNRRKQQQLLLPVQMQQLNRNNSNNSNTNEDDYDNQHLHHHVQIASQWKDDIQEIFFHSTARIHHRRRRRRRRRQMKRINNDTKTTAMEISVKDSSSSSSKNNNKNNNSYYDDDSSENEDEDEDDYYYYEDQSTKTNDTTVDTAVEQDDDPDPLSLSLLSVHDIVRAQTVYVHHKTTRPFFMCNAPKTGCTLWKNFILYVNENITLDPIEIKNNPSYFYKQYGALFSNSYIASIIKSIMTNNYSTSNTTTNTNTNRDELIQQWIYKFQTTDHIIIARNPYVRFLSSYKDFLGRASTNENDTPFRKFVLLYRANNITVTNFPKFKIGRLDHIDPITKYCNFQKLFVSSPPTSPTPPTLSSLSLQQEVSSPQTKPPVQKQVQVPIVVSKQSLANTTKQNSNLKSNPKSAGTIRKRNASTSTSKEGKIGTDTTSSSASQRRRRLQELLQNPVDGTGNSNSNSNSNSIDQDTVLTATRSTAPIQHYQVLRVEEQTLWFHQLVKNYKLEHLMKEYTDSGNIVYEVDPSLDAALSLELKTKSSSFNNSGVDTTTGTTPGTSTGTTGSSTTIMAQLHHVLRSATGKEPWPGKVVQTKHVRNSAAEIFKYYTPEIARIVTDLFIDDFIYFQYPLWDGNPKTFRFV